MTRKEKREIKRKINFLYYQLNDINFKLSSIVRAYHSITENCTDKHRYYGVELTGPGFSTPLNLPADYLCDILAYGEPFLRHKKTEIEDEIRKLNNQLDEAK